MTLMQRPQTQCFAQASWCGGGSGFSPCCGGGVSPVGSIEVEQVRQRIGGEAGDMFVVAARARERWSVYVFWKAEDQEVGASWWRRGAMQSSSYERQSRTKRGILGGNLGGTTTTTEYSGYSAPNPAVSSIAKTSLRSRLCILMSVSARMRMRMRMRTYFSNDAYGGRSRRLKH